MMRARRLAAVVTATVLAAVGAGVTTPPAMAASASCSGVSTWSDLVAAFAVANPTVPNVTLCADITAPAGASLVTSWSSTVLDLNGHALTISEPPSGMPAIYVPSTSQLDVQDNSSGHTGALTAIGGAGAAGIGGEGNGGATASTGYVTIDGGAVSAQGGAGGAGIGGGRAGGIEGFQEDSDGLAGGVSQTTVTAVGGAGAAGIGSGAGATAGVRFVESFGGNLTARAGAPVSGTAPQPGIGSPSAAVVLYGTDASHWSNVTISGGVQWASDFEVRYAHLTIPAGSSLVIPQSTTLQNDGEIVNDGLITDDGRIFDVPDAVPGFVTNNGTIVMPNPQAAVGGTVTGHDYQLQFDDGSTRTTEYVYADTAAAASVAFPDFDVSGWYQGSDASDPVTAGTSLSGLLGQSTGAPLPLTLSPIHLDPTLSPTTGLAGTPVTITGSGFTSADTVTIGGNAAAVTNVSVDGTQLTATVPAASGLAGQDGVVTVSDGTVTTTLTTKFHYAPVPTAGVASASTSYGAPVTIPASLEASDEVSSLAIATPPAHGTAAVSGTNLEYTPGAGFFGTDSFTYTASNADGTSSPATVTVTVAAPELTVTPASGALSGGVVGESYSVALTGSGGATPYSFAVHAGDELPAGLTLQNSGQGWVLAGTPTSPGDFSFALDLTDSSNPNPASGTFDYTLEITQVPTLTTAELAPGAVGSRYTATVAGAGFPAPTFAVRTGSLPAGLVLDPATGAISGVPTQAGHYPFSVTASSAAGEASRAFSLDITTTLTLSSATPKQGGTLLVSASGLAPGTAVTLTAHSTPVTIGTLTADASGTVSTNWTVPADFATGAHELTLTLADGTVVASIPFTVLAADPVAAAMTSILAMTGTDVLPAAALAGGLLAAGLLAPLIGALLRRRRRAQRG